MPYCTSYFKFLSNDFGVSESKTRTLPYKTWGSGGYHFVSIAYSISSFTFPLQSVFPLTLTIEISTHPTDISLSFTSLWYFMIYEKSLFLTCPKDEKVYVSYNIDILLYYLRWYEIVIDFFFFQQSLSSAFCYVGTEEGMNSLFYESHSNQHVGLLHSST